MPEEHTKASVLLRIVAKAIDLIIVAVLAKSISQVGFLAGVVYLLISDGLFDGRSLGKKIINLQVISRSGKMPASFRDSILRNSILALGLLLFEIPLAGWLLVIVVFAFECLLVIGNSEGMRLGDDVANTQVVVPPR
jgi:uncharacterized RDD family membrane protein YckC